MDFLGIESPGIGYRDTDWTTGNWILEIDWILEILDIVLDRIDFDPGRIRGTGLGHIDLDHTDLDRIDLDHMDIGFAHNQDIDLAHIQDIDFDRIPGIVLVHIRDNTDYYSIGAATGSLDCLRTTDSVGYSRFSTGGRKSIQTGPVDIVEIVGIAGTVEIADIVDLEFDSESVLGPAPVVPAVDSAGSVDFVDTVDFDRRSPSDYIGPVDQTSRPEYRRLNT